MSQPAFTYYGRPTFMQDVLAPLIQLERMQALVQDSILNIQELYDATPQGNTPVRLALNQAMIHLGDANRELDRQKLFQYLIVVNEIQERIRQTGRVPVVNYNDPGSDIWLTFCGNGWLQWHVSNWDLFMMRRCHDEIYLGNVWQVCLEVEPFHDAKALWSSLYVVTSPTGTCSWLVDIELLSYRNGWKRELHEERLSRQVIVEICCLTDDISMTCRLTFSLTVKAVMTFSLTVMIWHTLSLSLRDLNEFNFVPRPVNNELDLLMQFFTFPEGFSASSESSSSLILVWPLTGAASGMANVDSPTEMLDDYAEGGALCHLRSDAQPDKLQPNKLQSQDSHPWWAEAWGSSAWQAPVWQAPVWRSAQQASVTRFSSLMSWGLRILSLTSTSLTSTSLTLSPTSFSHKILIFDELRSEDPEPDKQVWILFRGDSEPLPLDGLSFTQEMRLEQGWPYTYVKPPHTQKPDLKNVKSPQSL